MCVGCLDFASFRGFLLAVGTVPTVANALFVCFVLFFFCIKLQVPFYHHYKLMLQAIISLIFYILLVGFFLLLKKTHFLNSLS